MSKTLSIPVLFSNLFMVLCMLAGLCSCNFQRHYVKDDYPFYQHGYLLPKTTLLKTNGVYVLDRIVTSETDSWGKQPKERLSYKFYPGGQVNLIVDLDDKLKRPENYQDAFNEAISRNEAAKSATLFEGYYRLNGDRLVIQRMSTPRKQFEYTYALVRENELIVVKSTIERSGKIANKYFTNYYKAYYRFLPTDTNYVVPNW